MGLFRFARVRAEAKTGEGKKRWRGGSSAAVI